MFNTQTRAQIFDSALQEHSGAMLHYLYSLSKDWGVAEDLSQELWKTVHKHFTDEAISQKNLLYYKAKQVFLDHYRKRKRRIDLDFMDEIPEPAIMPVRAEPETEAENQRLYENFWELFYPDEYDELSKRIFWLKERYGYSMDEIALKTNLPRSTAHDKLTKLKNACRTRLEITNQEI